MGAVEYLELDKIDPKDFLPILNKQKTREHLIDHDQFDEATINAWISDKLKMDQGDEKCKIRAILVDRKLAGWCGIQPEGKKYEMAIVIDESYRGLGLKIFREIIQWAKILDHKTLLIHFLHTRPQYEFLKRIARNTYVSELLGDKFTTYELAVERI